MARELSSIEPEEQYRAVILYKHSGMHDLTMKTYTDTDGQTYDYHRVYVFGPYEKPGPAKAMVKRDIRHAEQGYRSYYDWSQPYNQRTEFPVSDVHGIIESSVPVWGLFYDTK